MSTESGVLRQTTNDKREQMKTKMMAIVLVITLMSGITQAQTPPVDWSWTFQWHGQERGILFAQTNLSKSVKAAIRDDIVQVMSKVEVSSTEIYPARPNNPDYGEVDGLMNIRSKEHICPDGFPIGYYRMINGTPYFLLSEEDCDLYVKAIGLTNSAAAKISKLPAALVPFTNGFNTASMTLKQKEAHIWNPKFSQMKKDNRTQYESDITEALPTVKDWMTILRPSVLSYSHEDLEDNGKPLLMCRLYVIINRPGDPEPFTFIFVFKDGIWRWCPEIF